jgi:hypothetical protein
VRRWISQPDLQFAEYEQGHGEDAIERDWSTLESEPSRPCHAHHQISVEASARLVIGRSADPPCPKDPPNGGRQDRSVGRRQRGRSAVA